MIQNQLEETRIYSAKQLETLDKERIPVHVAFMPDGNRRWARKNKLSAAQGHLAGANILMDIVKAAKELKIKVVTFYTISTENWSRDPLELRALLWLLESYLRDQQQTMIDNGVRMHSIGDLKRFPLNIRKTIQATKDATAHCTDIDMVLALNYGARDEIRRVFINILDDFSNQKLKREEITENLISRYLDTGPWQDPDLLIRTSGEQRLSNFLLWQTSYAEMYTTNVLWPDFSSQHLLEAILEFQKRERRLGGS